MRVASAIVAGLVLAALAVLVYRAEDDPGAAEGLGSAIGKLLVAFLIAWLIRLAWVKSRGEGSVRSHWLLWLAVVGMLFAMMRDVPTEAERTAEIVEYSERQRERCGDVPDFEMPRIGKWTSRAMRSHEYVAALPDLPAISAVEVLAVEEDRQTIAIVSVVFVSDEDAEGLRQGMVSGAEEAGGRADGSRTVDGVQIAAYQAPAQRMLLFRASCRGFTVVAADAAAADLIAERIVKSLR